MKRDPAFQKEKRKKKTIKLNCSLKVTFPVHKNRKYQDFLEKKENIELFSEKTRAKNIYL